MKFCLCYDEKWIEAYLLSHHMTTKFIDFCWSVVYFLLHRVHPVLPVQAGKWLPRARVVLEARLALPVERWDMLFFASLSLYFFPSTPPPPSLSLSINLSIHLCHFIFSPMLLKVKHNCEQHLVSCMFSHTAEWVMHEHFQNFISQFLSPVFLDPQGNTFYQSQIITEAVRNGWSSSFCSCLCE